MGCLRQQCIYCLKRDPFCLNQYKDGLCVIFEDTRDDCQFPEKNFIVIDHGAKVVFHY